MKTTRISSGFDVELQLGANWFLTALNLLNDNGLLGPPGVPIIILNVQISFEPGFDLQIDIAGLSDPVLASAELNATGTELIITTNIPQIPTSTIPFGALHNLAEPPILVKRAGDTEHEAVIALLANLDIHAEPQSVEPKPEGEFEARGNADDAVSFLPLGQDIAFGMGKTTLSRFANNIWHANLRAEDGTHPLPDEENKRGNWSKVEMKSENGKIRIKIEGDIPVDSPIIDVIPDPHVTITLILTPTIIDGKLSFSIKPETDIDTGLLGDLFAGITGGITGGIIGFIVGLITGGILSAILIGAAIGGVVAIIVIEIVEVVIEGKVQKIIKAKINGESLADIHCCEDGIVQIATPNNEDAFDLSFLDSIPTSIAVNTSNPQGEILYKRSLLVTSVYDDLVVDSDGFGISGISSTGEKFQPEVVSISNFNYEGDRLASITYQRSGGAQQEVLIEEVFNRIGLTELMAPFKIFQRPEESSVRIPEGKLACVCLKPIAIHQEETVVKQIEFENSLRINVADAIALQDAAGIVVTGYQLIHPKNYNAYYRAKADFFKDNNFESLPKF